MNRKRLIGQPFSSLWKNQISSDKSIVTLEKLLYWIHLFMQAVFMPSEIKLLAVDLEITGHPNVYIMFE